MSNYEPGINYFERRQQKQKAEPVLALAKSQNRPVRFAGKGESGEVIKTNHKNCRVCGSSFEANTKNQRFCGAECRTKNRSNGKSI